MTKTDCDMENYQKCPFCGNEIPADALECKHCGRIITDSHSAMAEAYNVASSAPDPSRKNGIATTGFIFSLISLGLSWLPGFNIILWILAIVFSSVGLSRSPKGYAIAGLIISAVVSVLIVLFAFLTYGLVEEYLL